jgi:hypothetical protein
VLLVELTTIEVVEFTSYRIHMKRREEVFKSALGGREEGCVEMT